MQQQQPRIAPKNRYSRLAEMAQGWCSAEELSTRARRQARAIVSISNMLNDLRFPSDCEVKILTLLVCKLCPDCGDDNRCATRSHDGSCQLSAMPVAGIAAQD